MRYKLATGERERKIEKDREMESELTWFLAQGDAVHRKCACAGFSFIFIISF
jgi:hypothetical protein